MAVIVVLDVFVFVTSMRLSMVLMVVEYLNYSFTIFLERTLLITVYVDFVLNTEIVGRLPSG